MNDKKKKQENRPHPDKRQQSGFLCRSASEKMFSISSRAENVPMDKMVIFPDREIDILSVKGAVHS